jgi:hypothetical protein
MVDKRLASFIRISLDTGTYTGSMEASSFRSSLALAPAFIITCSSVPSWDTYVIARRPSTVNSTFTTSITHSSYLVVLLACRRR